MHKNLLLNNTLTPEFDYVYLINLLSGYADPWGCIRRLIQCGDLVRVKKGLYILGERFEKLHSNFVLANLIYGPSYISFASALSYYGLIPEATQNTTSVTPIRYKKFNTPVGEFEYYFQNVKLYSQEMELIKIDNNRNILIASPEKALFDLLFLRAKVETEKQAISVGFLTEGLRLEESSIKKLSVIKLEKLGTIANSQLGLNLAKCIRILR